jgi:predicted DNA-binding WGR domain protein
VVWAPITRLGKTLDKKGNEPSAARVTRKRAMCDCAQITHFARSPFRLIHSACTVRKSRTKSRRINAVILYRNDRARRMHRYYRLDVQPNLFGEWCLMRERGRIGSSGGQLRSLPFATEQEAEAALAKAATRETKTQLCISPG